jgi:hypothetical protein
VAISPRAELIKIYATHPVDEVQSTPEYQHLLDIFEHDQAFATDRDQIEQYKVRAEVFLDKPGLTRAGEVREALKLLIAYRNDPRRETYYQLIEAGYMGRWSPAQQRYLAFAWKKIRAKLDYFLSFTTRRPDPHYENPVNTDYRSFIVSKLGAKEYRCADRKTRNLLAETIHFILSNPPTKGFFFPDVQYDNSITLNKLDDAAEGSLTFVQLVQNMMFEVPDQEGVPNYCWMEFKRALELAEVEEKKPEDRLLFLVAEADRATLTPELQVPGEYTAWYAHIRQRDPPFLNPKEKPEALTDLLWSKLLTRLRAALGELVAGVPED